MRDREVLNQLAAGGQYLVELYGKWAKDPQSVDPSFAHFFSSLGEKKHIVEADSVGPTWEQKEKSRRQEIQKQLISKKKISNPTQHTTTVNGEEILAVAKMIHDFRNDGHLWTSCDPLNLRQPREEFSLSDYGFSSQDENKPVFTGHLLKDLLGEGQEHALGVIVRSLKNVYCQNLGFEFLYVKSDAQKQWLIEAIEGEMRRDFLPSKDERLKILSEICYTQGFEDFCHKRFVGAKRFGLEGGEVFTSALNIIIEQATQKNGSNIVIGMAHRGRLNTLVNVMNKPYSDVFAEFDGDTDGLFPYGSGDVKYHLGYHSTKKIGQYVANLYLLPNPSHLEAVDPVVCGAVRALQDSGQQNTLGILVHGDAAFAAQGVVYETLEMSQLEGYQTGGTIHIVINNQIGFTTNPQDGTSGCYGTDIAKAIGAPVFHVNGDEPDDVVYAAKLAFAYREHFGSDVVLDIVCFRRYGHNEIDEPVFTQPEMYHAIREHEGLYKLYGDALCKDGLVSHAQIQTIWDDFTTKLETSFVNAKEISQKIKEKTAHHDIQHGSRDGDNSLDAITSSEMVDIGRVLTDIPDGFELHRKIVRQLKHKKEMFEGKACFDWATAEALAFGTLLMKGKNIRFSGEDSQRGTFSQRHMVWFDQKTQKSYVPLQHINNERGRIDVWNSLLSEYGVLGFEYGYSVFNPQTLTIWEAQFGDFVNCGQVIIDQFISAARSKWNDESGLVMLLPHGYEGQGPEHSSARLERFLQLCAEDNMIVCNVSAPANYYHLLRRQAYQTKRRPLVVMAPKSLLRLPSAVSPKSDFIENLDFEPVIDDEMVKKSDVRRIIFCSGKVYYDLLSQREERQIKDVAIIRIEQLYPVPQEQLISLLKSYPKATIIWCQEEPKNCGPWNFIHQKLEAIMHQAGYQNARIQYAGRDASASPATGVFSRHEAQRKSFVEQALTIIKE